MRTFAARALAAGFGIGLAACSSSTSSEEIRIPVSDLSLSSSAFTDGGVIPRKYTCDGAGLSPPLAWDGVPDGVARFALIVEDPDANGFVHWVLTDISGAVTELAEGQGDAVGTPGANSAGGQGWTGPCPPSGEHHYVFTLYALSEPLSIGPGASASAVRGDMQDHVLGQAQLTGVYSRG